MYNTFIIIIYNYIIFIKTFIYKKYLLFIAVVI